MGRHRVQRGMSSFGSVGASDDTQEIVMHRRLGLETVHGFGIMALIILGIGMLVGHYGVVIFR